MANPTVYLVICRSHGIEDLRAAMLLFRRALSRLRRRVLFSRTVRAGCGAMETKLVSTGHHWELHAHLVLDQDGLDDEWVAECWRKLTGSRGQFRLSANPVANKRYVSALARYITKADTWCPRPFELSATAFSVLAQAIHGRQLPIQWGARALGPTRPFDLSPRRPVKPPTKRGRPSVARGRCTGRDLRHWRERMRVTQEEAAALLGRTSRTIRTYEACADGLLPADVADHIEQRMLARSGAARTPCTRGPAGCSDSYDSA